MNLLSFKFASNCGFSLIETLATLAISSLLLTLSLGGINQFREIHQSTIERRISTLLSTTAALSNHSATPYQCIIMEQTNLKCSNGHNTLSLKTPKSVRIKLKNREHLSFYKNQEASPGTLELTSSNRICAIKISRKARINSNCHNRNE